MVSLGSSRPSMALQVPHHLHVHLACCSLASIGGLLMSCRRLSVDVRPWLSISFAVIVFLHSQSMVRKLGQVSTPFGASSASPSGLPL